MHGIKFITLSLVALLYLDVASPCEKPQAFYEFRLGSKTPYRFVANRDETPPQYTGCTAKKIWTMFRHGTRNPSAAFITKMKERLPEIRDLVLENNEVPSGKLRSRDLDNLRKWKTKLVETDEKKLTHEGEEELLALAERMQSRYPNLFPFVYSNTTYFFKYTKSQRTKASARYFVAGLFGKQTVADVWFPPAEKADPILRFYKLCTKWQEDVKHNPETDKEKNIFENSDHITSAVKSVNKILNLNNELSIDDVHLMHMTCAFETAWNKKHRSPWCPLLTDEAVEAVEFLEDLKFYYQDGYGYELTYAQACPAFKDFVEFFENPSEFPKSISYFTHSGTMLKMLAHMGLYKDKKPLSAAQYKKVDYKWRTSKIDTFGSNLAFVLYDCQGKLNVVTLHQESVVQLPGCAGDICSLDVIKKHFSKSMECPFDEMCGLE